MREPEKKALEWIKKTYKLQDNEIEFKSNRSPDFITKVGSFEAKTLVCNKYITFNGTQFEDLKKNHEKYKLIIVPEGIEEPFVMPFTEVIQQYIIGNEPRECIAIPYYLLAQIDEAIKDTEIKTRLGFINKAVTTFLKQYKNSTEE